MYTNPKMRIPAVEVMALIRAMRRNPNINLQSRARALSGDMNNKSEGANRTKPSDDDLVQRFEIPAPQNTKETVVSNADITIISLYSQR